MDSDTAQNTDKELWRKVPGDFYSPSIHVTADGRIGIDVGGHVFVSPVENWHKFAKNNESLQSRLAEVEAENERLRNEINARKGDPVTRLHNVCAAISGDVEELTNERDQARQDLVGALNKIEARLKKCSEERYQLMTEWEQEAEKWKNEGDMYGWNFHKGMVAGANWTDIVYRRIANELEAIRALKPSGKEEPNAR